MSAPVLHIGYHKTGTTWFQRRVYPAARGHVLAPQAAVRAHLLECSAFAFDAEAARRDLTPADGWPVVCDEDLCGWFGHGGYYGHMAKTVADRLVELWPGARVVILVRNQLDMIASTYMQYVKAGGLQPPHRYLRSAAARRGAARVMRYEPVFSFDHFAYDGLVGYYQRLFGPDAVLVGTHEALRADRTAFLAWLADAADLGLPVRDLDFTTENRAMGARTLRAARRINRVARAKVPDRGVRLPLVRNRTRRRVIHALDAGRLASAPPDSETVLGPDLAAFIRDRYAASNRALAAMTGLPLAAYRYPGVTGATA